MLLCFMFCLTLYFAQLLFHVNPVFMVKFHNAFNGVDNELYLGFLIIHLSIVEIHELILTIIHQKKINFVLE